jgi:hypothetical protein
MPARTIGTELGELIVELNLHPHGTKGLNSMWLIGLHKAGMARFKDRLGGGIKHPDNAPYPGLGAMLPAQSGGQGILIEYWCSLIRFCC